MCRHLAYLGPPRGIDSLLFDAPHSLLRQACAPREMVFADDNPDGWGVAWWPGPGEAPRHHRSATPMWEDATFDGRGGTATALLGAVRKASPATSLDRVANNAPFVAPTRSGTVAFSLNGNAFHASCADRLRAAVAPGTPLLGDTDSEMLFALVREQVEAGVDLAPAVAAVHHRLDPGEDAYVNMLLTTADRVVATTWNHTLYVRATDDATFVASEPLDDHPDWTRVPDAHLLERDRTGTRCRPLAELR